MITSFFEPDCVYKSKCSDKGYKCGHCKNNKKSKESHYEPYRIIPWTPSITPDGPWRQPGITYL